VFIANADGTIVLATNGTISSHFFQLENAGWLTTSYVLAMCAAQPIVRFRGHKSRRWAANCTQRSESLVIYSEGSLIDLLRNVWIRYYDKVGLSLNCYCLITTTAVAVWVKLCGKS
jgi:hypothetical protein